MKFTKIALAVAATLVAGQAFAAAVVPGDIAAARSAGTLKEVWFAGSSAFTLPEFLGFEKLCDAGTTAIFDNATSGTKPGSTGNYPTYACKIGGVVNVLYNNNGGSALAYAPFLPTTNALSTFKTTALTRLAKIDTNTCTTATGGAYTHTELKTGTTVATPVYGSCATVVNPTGTGNGPLTIAGGITDVEAALFSIKSLKGIGSEAATNLGQTFGVVVNTSLYRALQAAQGITESGNNFDPALAPNITKEQYASITQANETSFQLGWTNLIAGNTTPVYLIRRSADSGTQASSQAYFLGNPCNNGNFGQLAPASTGLGSNIWATPNLDSFTVYESGSTGNVKARLTQLDTGATIAVDDGTGTGTVNSVVVPAGSFGIGVISLTEDWRAETTAANDGYRFVKVDGVHPEAGSATGATQTSPFFGTQNVYTATTTVVNGSYPYYMESRAFTQAGADAYSAGVLKNLIAGLDSPNTCALTPRGISLLNGITSCASSAVQVTKNGNNCAIPTFAF